MGNELGTSLAPPASFPPFGTAIMDSDLEHMSREDLVLEVRKLRAGIRAQRSARESNE